MGRIEVICGCMFCGKTKLLIERLKRAVIAEQGVQVFVPTTDDRHGVGNVVSHDATSLQSTGLVAQPIDPNEPLIDYVSTETRVVGIDEAQFFGVELPDHIKALVDMDIRVIVAGLDLDSNGNSFGCMPEILAQADKVTKLTAVCSVCKGDATRSFRKIKTDAITYVGGAESYEARCRSCWKLGLR